MVIYLETFSMFRDAIGFTPEETVSANIIHN